MKTPIKLFSLFLFSLFLINCGSDNDDMDTGVDPDPDPETNPIPNQTTTYEADIKVIMSSNCNNCHGDPLANGAPIPLVTFNQVVEAVNNNNLFGRMSTTNMNNVMPQSGRLPDATILLVEDWIADGLKE